LLLVPDLCLLESASVLRKQVLRTVPAMELVIDATYLALALRHGAGLITADRDLDAAARACGCTAD
jgi:predicted nucleic acid-binding protein